MTRTEEIVNACKEVIRQLENWMLEAQKQRLTTKRLPEHTVKAIEYAVAVCHSGDTPSECQQLACIAMPKLGEELRQYLLGQDGSAQPDGLAGPMFWKAAGNIKELLFTVETSEPEQLEPVHALLSQKVSHEQIAKYIYGFRGEGPFILKNGMVDYAAVDREAKYPGSVIPKGWIHPSKKKMADDRQKGLGREMEVYRELEKGPKRYEDPQSVEEMLYAGAFIQQIEKGKNVSREHVLAVAGQLGLKAVDGPEYRQTMNLKLPETKPLEERMAAAIGEPAAPSPLPGVTAEQDAQFINEQILSVHEGNPNMGSAEIVASLIEQGISVNSQKVAAVLRSYKHAEAKRQSAPA